MLKKTLEQYLALAWITLIVQWHPFLLASNESGSMREASLCLFASGDIAAGFIGHELNGLRGLRGRCRCRREELRLDDRDCVLTEHHAEQTRKGYERRCGRLDFQQPVNQADCEPDAQRN